ncbi:HDOD domain-containing protein [Neptuniibacter halophilus]|uniref:HDOD domain-containing protein n=1 Tax=Neptuniibacter halophilus TaxID=651666 RepID=UPI002572DF3E|nr:HDOD domain-containing protein [Neptuniibacter halophilus]
MPSIPATSVSYAIPARPEVLIGITEALRATEPDIQRICDLIKQDVALYTSVIATVNSSYFGISSEVTSVERAVSLLGIKRVFTIIRLATLKNSLNKLGTIERFWDTATEVAQISSALSLQFTNLDRDEAYTLGMLHDSGIPILMQARPDFKDFLRGMNGCSLTEIHNREIERYDISHYELSANLAKKWHISESTAEAIRRQPYYEQTFAEPPDESEEMRLRLCLLLLARDISDVYRHFWRIPDNKAPLLNLSPILSFLGISDFDYADLKEDIVNSLALHQ